MKTLPFTVIAFTVGTFLLGIPTHSMAKTHSKKRSRHRPIVHRITATNPLQERIDHLEENQKILERRLEVEQEKQEQKEKDKPKDGPIVGAGKEGFFIRSADKNYQIKFRGTLQADARFYFEKNQDKISNTLLIRRARPIIEGSVSKYFDFRFAPDFGEGKAVIQDAYIDAHPLSELKIQVGKFKEPIGLERLQSDTNLLFVEYGLPTLLTPNRDLGAELHGEIKDGLLSYAVGVFNGVADNASGDSDSNDEKDIAGRIFAHPFQTTSIGALKGLGLGIAGSYGKQKGKSESSNLPSFKTSGQQTFFSYRSDGTDPNTVIAQGTHYRIAPQAYYYWGPVGLFGEYVLSSQKVSLSGLEDQLTHHAWQVAGSYVLGGKASYNGVNPNHPVNFKKRGFGALEIAGRYGELSIDPDTFPNFADPKKSAQKARNWGVGLNWYLNKNVKYAINYEQTSFKGGSSSGNRDTEKVLLNRFQLAF